MRYTYLGDKLTDPALVGMQCEPARRKNDGKCVVGRGSARVVDAEGREYIVNRRRLRLNR